ncbi:proprotein convertase subtilisin/kexin type 1 inhibitor, like [Pygocentrus nattereri]|uniref:proprotein convertase subtilisin/kexin type 1 inhibitor, like n=1 Tax=Pygocentrus nattereri TaxID=42514 RepID=UPI0008145E13|nr:proprotein convertase subtilisin/kexin type 1 inhibitor, like [Pygocentrus nattereri]
MCVQLFSSSVSLRGRGSFILSCRMSGPRTSSILLLFTIASLQNALLEAKPLSAMHGGGAVRLRRDLRDSLPYEAQMMSYPTADFKGRGNELYYQPEAVRAQGLGQALQRLMENDQRREQEAAYLAGLLRLLNEAENNGQGKQEEEEEEEEGDFQGPYPPDYDETEQTVSMAKPQALLDPQLAEALLNRYRQERLLQAGLNPTSNRLPDREQERDQEVLRYLVEKILSSLAPGNQPSPSNRRAKRDVSAVASVGRGGASLRRSRRSVDSVPVPSPSAEASLLRVKRLGDEEDDEGFAAQSNRSPHAGLQRMKRIDTDMPLPLKHSRKRRAVSYDPSVIAQHILQYLPA